MAGQGNTLGCTWEDLRDIIELVDDKYEPHAARRLLAYLSLSNYSCFHNYILPPPCACRQDDIHIRGGFRSRVGVCFDTCHAFAAGHDIRTAHGFDTVLKEFDSVIGLQFLRAVHLNDSKGMGI